MTKPRILIQLDPDRHPSAFDRVVAVDAGVDHVFAYGGVRPEDAATIVHGAIFTRGSADLSSTAIFVGGSDVERAEELFKTVRNAFVGPLKVSVMLDPNGANTTAAAIIACARRHVDLSAATAVVLGGTGPVGVRAALLLCKAGSGVQIASRSLEKAASACEAVKNRIGNSAAKLAPLLVDPDSSLQSDLVISAGAPGVRMLSREQLARNAKVKVVVDANAVPPAGIEGVEVADRGKQAEGFVQYGALGIGAVKMKIHKAAIAAMFEANDRVLDAEAISDLAIAFA